MADKYDLIPEARQYRILHEGFIFVFVKLNHTKPTIFINLNFNYFMGKFNQGLLRGQVMTPMLGRIAGRKDGSFQTAQVKVTNPQSAGQMFQRLKMLTTVPLYNVLREAIALGWENIPEGRSLYNCFTGMAMRSTPFGISKELYDRGAGIAWAAQITSGTLPVIAVSNHVSNIVLSGISKIDATTTVGALADAIVKGNPGRFSYDDEIAFIEVQQTIDSEGTPKLSCTRSAVILEQNCTETLAGLPSLKGFAVIGGQLGIVGTPAIGAYAWVHSRMEEGKMRVSTQSLITNNEAVLAAYGAPAKLRAAAKSLGADLLSEKFLKPTNSNARRALAAFGLTAGRVKGALGGADNGIIAVEYDGGMYLAGESGPEIKKDVAPDVKVIVSDGSVLGTVLQARINGESITNPVRDGNTIELTIPAALDGEILRVLTVMDVNHTWKIEL